MICQVEDCNREVHAKGYCMKHYQVFRKKGYIPTRNKYTPNEIIKYKDYAEMIIYDIESVEIVRTKISLDKVNLVKDIRWGYSKGYIENRSVGRLHRYIMNVTDPNLEVDHIFHDELDNRTDKLRIVTRSQNNMNHRISKNNKSGVKGVYYHKGMKKWHIGITVNRKVIDLGYKEDLEEAKRIRLEAEIKYFGEYRYKGDTKVV